MTRLEWLSPLENDEFAEYRDAAFLERLGLGSLSGALADFWPRRGPQWDALAVTGRTVVLVEAKAHIDEFLSPGSQASDVSLEEILKSLDRTKQSLGVDPRVDWANKFYQYANRIAHLDFLCRQGVDARLLLVGFVGDEEMGGPKSPEAWKVAYRVADYALGLPKRHRLASRVLHVYPDVRELA